MIEVYTIDELAKAFKVSKKTITRWAKKGTIPAPILNDNRWDKPHFDAWYRSRIETFGTFGTSETEGSEFRC